MAPNTARQRSQAPAATTGRRDGFRQRLLCLVLFLITWAVYEGTRHNGFAFDDTAFFFENAQIRAGLTLEGLRWAFTSFFAGNWFPATLTSHLLDVQVFGLSPAGHHATSVLLHSANAVLLFLWLARATGAVWRSFFVAALFAVHPLHVESVAWVSARKDVLSTFFGLLALWAYLDYTRRRRRAMYLAASGLFALSLLSKSMLATLPFVLLLLDWWPLGRLASPLRPAAPTLRSAVLLEKLPFVALSAASVVVTFFAQREWGAVLSGRFFGIPARASNALVAYVGYLGKTVWPVGLAAFYPHPGPSIPLWKWLAAGLGLAAATVLFLALRRSRPALLSGWLWYVGTLVPVIGIVQVGAQAMADRYTYIPLVGVFLAAAWAIPRLPRRGGGAAALVWGCLGTLVVLALAAVARTQVRVWKNDLTLFTHAARAVPGNWLAEYNVGKALENIGNEDAAVPHYLEALRSNYYDFDTHASLAKIMERRGNLRGAIERYRFAILVDPSKTAAKLALARALARNRQPREAIAIYDELLRLDPKRTDVSAERSALLPLLERN